MKDLIQYKFIDGKHKQQRLYTTLRTPRITSKEPLSKQ